MAHSLTFVYTKMRCRFGRPCRFIDSHMTQCVNIEPDPLLSDQFVQSDVVDRSVQNAPEFCLDEVNTHGTQYTTQSVHHVEGGWPKEINWQDIDQVSRYRKKIERDEQYTNIISEIAADTEHFVKQNNAIDIYNTYYSEPDSVASGPPRISTNAILKLTIKPDEYVHTVSKLSLCPFNDAKLAASYCSFRFHQAMYSSNNSYIWNLETATCESTLSTYSSLTSIQYNPRDHFCIAGGCHNGQVAIWDTRKGTLPTLESKPISSHHDPVWNTIWIQSKASSDFFTGSTGGAVKWWDIRRLSEPYEIMLMDLTGKDSIDHVEGVYALSYDPSIPTRFMVGTDAGHILISNRKGKTILEKVGVVYQGHMGPVYAVQRNPVFPKNFLTVGDWTARIWSDDIKEHSLMATPMGASEITDGCWNPIRPAVFYVTRANGTLEAWDFIYSQKIPVMSVKITDGSAISCLLVHEEGNTMICGDENGIIRCMKVSSGFTQTTKSEKQQLYALLEMEKRRERLYEQRYKELKKAIMEAETDLESERYPSKHLEPPDRRKQSTGNAATEKAEEDFFQYINEWKEKLQKDREAFVKEENTKNVMAKKSKNESEVPVTENTADENQGAVV